MNGAGGVRATWNVFGTALLCSVMGGCSEKNNVDKPVAPDMGALVSAYEHPTVALSSSRAIEAVAEQALLGEMMDRLTTAFPEIEEAVNQGLFSDGESGPFGVGESSDRKPLRVTGAGYLKVVRICPGVDPDSGPKDENGTINLVVGFTEQGVDPVVWGTVRSCQFVVGGEALILDGDVQLHIGENLQFDGFGAAPILVHIAGSLQSGGGDEAMDVDFRVLPDGTIEYRLMVDGGHVVYWERVTERGIRAANDNFSCDFEARLCSGDSGALVDW